MNEKTKDQDELGLQAGPLCREPWESYYILRRGILPCCYGNPIVAPMDEWSETWNSSQLQEIRRYLARGELSPYCRESLGCPIVQRVLAQERAREGSVKSSRPGWQRRLNRLFLGLPARIYRKLFPAR
ncbi:MAG: hypothetical protein DRJ11_10875 [Candidatus Aminicenantes bacterium]|nr:SPASM domain-containing protein [Candidatus Aminicenantes bacterium]RLE00883.1 MAG: hypothetical protein DRJ11_10875 [Candidatus Aminicenantes bacterium]HHF42308.1 hypothetical protein [Candidatus Aminicenantes bacterium]